MTVVRNIQVKLNVPEDAHSVLDETFEQFRHAAQYVADYGWADDPTEIVTDQSDLNAATYDGVREETDLHSSHVQSARSLASEALHNCQDRIFDGGNASNPTFRGTVVVFGTRTITYNDDYCTLATVDGRVPAEYVTPDESDETPFEDYWNNDEWERKEATCTSGMVRTTSTSPWRKSLTWMRHQSRTERFSALTSTSMAPSPSPAQADSSAMQTT